MSFAKLFNFEYLLTRSLQGHLISWLFNNFFTVENFRRQVRYIGRVLLLGAAVGGLGRFLLFFDLRGFPADLHKGFSDQVQLRFDTRFDLVDLALDGFY